MSLRVSASERFRGIVIGTYVCAYGNLAQAHIDWPNGGDILNHRPVRRQNFPCAVHRFSRLVEFFQSLGSIHILPPLSSIQHKADKKSSHST